MGNACFGKKTHNKGVVHPVVAVHRDQAVTIKVRMTKSQLKGLVEKVDASNDIDDSELGRLIVQECSKGKLHARIVAAANGGYDHSYRFSRGQEGLRPIQEDSEERYHDV